jgi:3-oxoacyl-(acyl-carrier-protein) synthase
MTAPFGRPVYVVGAAALTPFGAGWRGLAARLAAGERPPHHAVPPLEPGDEPCEPRHRKMMSRAAYLAAAVVKMALGDPAVAATGVAPGDIGCFLGVGASGGDMNELEAMLRASVVDGTVELPRFGDAGLRAANPLFAFQLMNNFTLCHAAILAGLEGPNAAFFSRGAGTVTALREAAFAAAGGDAPLVLAGGADSAFHPVTALELAGPGAFPPSEGAAVLALAGQSTAATAATAATDATPVRLEVAEARAGAPTLRQSTPETIQLNGADVDVALGQTLAAAPALAWAVALDLLRSRPRGRVCVQTTGLDGTTAVVEFVKEPA